MAVGITEAGEGGGAMLLLAKSGDVKILILSLMNLQ